MTTTATTTTYRLYYSGDGHDFRDYGKEFTDRDSLIRFGLQAKWNGNLLKYSENDNKAQDWETYWTANEIEEMRAFSANLPDDYFISYNAEANKYELCNGSSDNVVASVENLEDLRGFIPD